MIQFLTATIICTGMAPTHPKTNIEVEIRPGKFSTIRYEIAEGSLEGTAYIQSIGYMQPKRRGATYHFQSGTGPNATRLLLKVDGDQIRESRFSHYVSGMKGSLVECSAEEGPSDGHDGH